MKTIFHKSFDKDFEKLTKKIQNRTLTHIQLFQAQPYHPLLSNHALIGKYLGLRSINITGDIRAIYDPIADGLCMFIAIKPHSQLYG